MGVVCITRDRKLRQLVRRTLGTAETQLVYLDDAFALVEQAAPADSRPSLLIIDSTGEDVLALAGALANLPYPTSVLLLGPWSYHDEVLFALSQSKCDNLIAITEGVDEEELLVTCRKLTGSDIFGLEKYLSWGVEINGREIGSYDDKRDAIDEVAAFARSVGCRRQLIGRVELVVDEMLMNALYDAPSEQGADRAELMAKAIPGGGPLSQHSARLQYACDGRFFAVGVLDRFGSLKRTSIHEHLARAAQERGKDVHLRPHGGLGLYFIMGAVSRLVVNIAAGKASEVIGIFDLRQAKGSQYPIARSFNIFGNGQGLPAPAAPTIADRS